MDARAVLTEVDAALPELPSPPQALMASAARTAAVLWFKRKTMSAPVLKDRLNSRRIRFHLNHCIASALFCRPAESRLEKKSELVLQIHFRAEYRRDIGPLRLFATSFPLSPLDMHSVNLFRRYKKN
jgi:hypothetical protein